MIHLHGLIDSLRAGTVWEPTFRKMIAAAFPAQNKWLMSAAKQAVCFDMGDVEAVPKLKIITDLFRMPYPVTWFEATNRDGMLGLLACEVGPAQLHMGVFNKRSGSAWFLVGVVELYVDDIGELRCKSVALVSGDDEKDSEALVYATATASILARFVMAMNCTNTALIEHAAPKMMNAKRAAKGRQPLFSYWTLHLPSAPESEGQPLGGTHASPRLHLRRGHIRQFAPGKYTWIDACVVGSKNEGMVVKDYALESLAAGQKSAVP